MICVACSGDVHNQNDHYVVLGDSSVLHLSCYESQESQRPAETGGDVDKATDAYGGFWG